MGSQPFSCEHYDPKKRDSYHFYLRNLRGFDLEYLEALIKNDASVIQVKEGRARDLGYGPLVPCTFLGEPRLTREFCSKQLTSQV